MKKKKKNNQDTLETTKKHCSGNRFPTAPLQHAKSHSKLITITT